ncbi:MAG: hypothetical protein HYV27_03220 [Candidatus Hydrogenedentes bacterium]|nr:hypothetical protein [Candidatus Hydrogenedentota bacterium]
MKGVGYPDRLEVVNGPEDGTTFTLVRTPLDIGADPACAVHLRLDGAIRRIQARLTVVSDGYRVRALDRQPVYVNGKRAGLIRSRILRNQGTLQVGNTRLALVCSNGGLAERSHGLPTESDAWWFIHLALKTFLRFFLAIGGALPFLFGRSFRYLIPLLVVLGIAAAFLPGLRDWLQYALEYTVYLLRDLFYRFSG